MSGRRTSGSGLSLSARMPARSGQDSSSRAAARRSEMATGAGEGAPEVSFDGFTRAGRGAAAPSEWGAVSGLGLGAGSVSRCLGGRRGTSRRAGGDGGGFSAGAGSGLRRSPRTLPRSLIPSPMATPWLAVRATRLLKSRKRPAALASRAPTRPGCPPAFRQSRPMSARRLPICAAVRLVRASSRAASAPRAAIRTVRRAAGTAFAAAQEMPRRTRRTIHRTQRRMPRSHGRGFRSQARIASRPGGASSRAVLSGGSEMCSSERRLRRVMPQGRYPLEPRECVSISGPESYEFRSVARHVTTSLTYGGVRHERAGVRSGFGGPELVSVRASEDPSLCLSELLRTRACVRPSFGEAELVSVRASASPSLCPSELLRTRACVRPSF